VALVDIDMARLREITQPEGPVVMLNLYRFKSPEDRERFSGSMATLIGPILARLGAEIVYSGSVVGEFVADEKWDGIALVRYPNFQAFIELFADDTVGNEIEELRRSALIESRFMVTTA
jgi:hypothetical protein